MKNVLAKLFDEILRESENNPRFRERLEVALGRPSNRARDNDAPQKSPARSRNRRGRALVDPYVEFAHGEGHLRDRLTGLTVEQLKDVVSEHAMDSARLALKWKSAERLIDLIITTVRSRVEKGDAFRG